MKKSFLQIVFVFGFCTLLTFPNVNAQTQVAEHKFSLGMGDASGDYEDRGNAVATDKDGNVYITGSFESKVDFGIDPNNPPSLLTLSSNGDKDIFLAKYDKLGNLIWARSFGDTKTDEGLSVALDGDQNVIITGYFMATVDFDPSNGSNLTSNGERDIFIAKYKPDGSFIWAKGIGDIEDDEGHSVAIDSKNSIIVTGYFKEKPDFDPSNGNYLASNGERDIFLAKYDDAGTYIWAFNIGSTYDDEGHGVAIDSKDNIIITGYFMDKADFDPLGSGNWLKSVDDKDIFMAKYEDNSTHVWSFGFGDKGPEAGTSVAIDSKNNIALTGFFREKVNFDPYGSGGYISSNGEQDIFLAKYDELAKLYWVFGFGDAKYDEGRSVKFDPKDNILVAGFFMGYVDFDPDGTNKRTLKGRGSDNIFMAKYDSKGYIKWAYDFGDEKYNHANGITSDADGNVFITGGFSGKIDMNADIDKRGINVLVNSNKPMDIFLAKYEPHALPDPFITEWKATADGKITIPTNGSGYDYHYVISDMSDMEISQNFTMHQTGNFQISNLVSGHTYRIEITGLFPRIYFNNTGDTSKITKVTQWGKIDWKSFEKSFYGCSKMDVTAIDTPLLKNVINTSYMFSGCTTLKGIGANWAWHTKTITSMIFMFNSASSFNQNIGSWDVSNVVNFTWMFAGASSFNQNIGSWVVSKATSMAAMFYNATSFNQNLGPWNVSNVANMGDMFRVASTFNQNIGSWNVSKVNTMSNMFNSATSFNQNLASWDVSKVTTMQSMFAFAGAFNQNLGSWNISSVANMTSMLSSSGLDCNNYAQTLYGWANGGYAPSTISLGAASVKYHPAAQTYRDYLSGTKSWSITDGGASSACSIGDFITEWTAPASGNLTIPTTGAGYNYDVYWMNMTNAGVGDGMALNQTGSYTMTGLQNGDTYKVYIMGDFPSIYFNSTGDKDKITNVTQWGKIDWKSFDGAFRGCSNLDVTATDTPLLKNVSNVEFMFSGCTSLFGVGANWAWHTTNVTNMFAMFESAPNFNQNIGSWDVSNVTDMAAMFSYANSFNQNIGAWDVSKVTNMYSMFNSAAAFNQNIGAWDVSNVTDMYAMFNSATAFNQNIGAWDVSKVTNFQNMFTGASGFDQNLGNWDLSGIAPGTPYAPYFNFSGMGCVNYTLTLRGWVAGGTAPSNITLEATSITYSTVYGTAAHTALVTGKSWSITDGGADPACVNEWVGVTNSDWATASNWIFKTVPGTGEDVKFSDTAHSNVVLDNNKTVGEVDFNGADKLIVLGNHDLTAGSFVGSDANNYVKTSGTGIVKMTVANTATAFFPIGKSAYNPLEITNNTGSGDDFTANIIDEVYYDGAGNTIVTEPHVKRTWNIGKASANGGSGVDFKLYWNVGEESVAITTPTLNHFNSVTMQWEIATSGSGSPSGKTLTHTGYTGSFSPFAIGENAIPLPIELISFDAVPDYQHNKVNLMWQTAQEENNQEFRVMRSEDGVFWEQIGVVQGHGNSYSQTDYSFIDNTPNVINYYRLVQVDLDGNTTRSPIRFVNFKQIPGQIFNVYPNPVSGLFTIETQAESQYTITDIQGRILLNGVTQNAKTNIDLTSFSNGIYFLKIDGQVVKIVKE